MQDRYIIIFIEDQSTNNPFYKQNNKKMDQQVNPRQDTICLDQQIYSSPENFTPALLLMLETFRRSAPTLCQMSHVSCHHSHVTCHMSCVTCHMSCVTSCVSCVMFFSSSFFSSFFLSGWQNGGASWCRVCYQMRLPCLVLKQISYIFNISANCTALHCTVLNYSVKVYRYCMNQRQNNI